MDSCPYFQTMSPGFGAMPWMGWPAENLESMYPEIYYRVYPRIRDMCAVYDVPGNPAFFPHPSRQAVDAMVERIFMDCIAEMGDPELKDMEEHHDRQFGFALGGRRLLRDLVAILLIRELLRRRGIFRF